MALILSIETATKVCSVALHKDARLLALQSLFLEKSHSSQLAVLIDNITKYCDLELKDIDAIALSEGPGSYTGLRIGTSTAKGLCFSLDIPLIAVNTLQAMAAGVNRFSRTSLLCPMIDARRMEVYCMLVGAPGKVVMDTEAKIIDEASFEDRLVSNEIFFFGNGAAKCKPVITHPNAFFIDDVTPSADWVGEIACKKFENSEFEDSAYFEPFYLKDFQATKPKTT